MLKTDFYRFIGHREAIKYISTHQQKTSILYVYSSMAPFVQYYNHLFALPKSKIYSADIRDNISFYDEFKHNIEAEIETLKGKGKVWIIINKDTPIYHEHFNNKPGFDGFTGTEFETIKPILKRKSRFLLTFQNKDTACYLCDF